MQKEKINSQKTYGLYCNDNLICKYKTKEEANEALASRIRIKQEAAERIAKKDYKDWDWSEPVTECEFNMALVSSNYEVKEAEGDDVDAPKDMMYRITKDGEPFMDFCSKEKAMKMFVELANISAKQMTETVNQLATADFNKAMSYNLKYSEADALLWDLYQIPQYQIFAIPKEDVLVQTADKMYDLY